MYSSAVEQYFKDNYDWLQKNYPGINNQTLGTAFRFFKNGGGKAEEFLNELKKGKPLGYIIKNRYFYNSDFYVDHRVLIPRFETELLVEIALKSIKNLSEKELDVCEVGVGSGAISLSFLQEISSPKRVNLTVTDISKEALQVFDINLFRLGFKIDKDHKIEVLNNDRLKGIDKKFNLILSNPPYIKKEGDLSLVHDQVRSHEPALALFLDDDIYQQWFFDFFTQVEFCLKNNGIFIMEGHENHLEELSLIGKNLGFFNIELIKDLQGRIRFLKMKKGT